MSKIGKAMMSLFLDKRARDVMEHAKTQPGDPPHPQRVARGLEHQSQKEIKQKLDSKIDEIHNKPQKTATPTRQELIDQARRVRAQKQDVLADLSPEQRMKLQVMAMKAMMPPKPGTPEN
ncbi:hypothetical protein V5T82_08075 [Magnetovibrio sp. PR-2]|uniref:hypothetical protein n=1 Tax=Magnetovibrio sp. PR-2 TaxID=3120356 RepID=UPI002FCE389D